MPLPMETTLSVNSPERRQPRWPFKRSHSSQFRSSNSSYPRDVCRDISAQDSPTSLKYKSLGSLYKAGAEYELFKIHVFGLENAYIMRLLLLIASPWSIHLLMNHHHMIIDGVRFHRLLSDLE